jgi:hypothetical protein
MKYPHEDPSELAKLLRCKRYEQPPPGYFLSFSDKVIARIEAEQEAESVSWWSWLAERFDARPIFVCVYGLAVSSLLVMGFRLSEAFEADVVASAHNLSGSWLNAGPGSLAFLPDGLPQSAFATPTPASSLAATRLVFREEPGHFAFPGSGFHVQPASFGFPAR